MWQSLLCIDYQETQSPIFGHKETGPYDTHFEINLILGLMLFFSLSVSNLNLYIMYLSVFTSYLILEQDRV